MNPSLSTDTIFALSSGHGRAGIAVVRLSGPLAAPSLGEMTGPLPPARHAVVRKLLARNGDVIDEAMVLYFAAPHSVTGEDVVEFHIHGSPSVVERLLSELSAKPGLRLAEAGEFTRRAFANHKMDLVEVEGLSDLLQATGEAQRKLAIRQFLGGASRVFEEWRAQVTSALALFEASIDFSDEDDVASKAQALAWPTLVQLVASLEQALAQADRFGSIRSGLRVVMAGAPNVGKSSLVNALALRKAAIVSPIAGTTRDVVESQIQIAGLPLVLADTAGIRSPTGDGVEDEGIKLALAACSSADILVWVTAPDVDTEVGPPRAPDLLVQNKSDLLLIRNRNALVISVSTQTGNGLDEFRGALQNLVEDRVSGSEQAVVVRERHSAAVKETIRLLNVCLAQPNRDAELTAEDLRRAVRSLSSITGHVDVEDLLGIIFSSFCIGK